jgi:hypothetical protein
MTLKLKVFTLGLYIVANFQWHSASKSKINILHFIYKIETLPICSVYQDSLQFRKHVGIV